LYELEARQAGHLDIQEHEVDFMLLKVLQRLHAAVEASHQLEVGNLPDIVFQQLEGQGLIINGYASDFHIQ
jgi:hypothetical protein